MSTEIDLSKQHRFKIKILEEVPRKAEKEQHPAVYSGVLTGGGSVAVAVGDSYT